MSVSIVHTFPPLQTFNSRSWALLAIVILHVGFFWALTAGLVVHIGTPPRPPGDWVVIDPAKPPPVVRKPIELNVGPTEHAPIDDRILTPKLPEMIDDAVVGPTVPLVDGDFRGGSVEQPRQPVMIQPAIPVEGLSEPEYPAREIREQHTGTVLLSVQVLPNGRVGEVRIDQSSGYPRLDASATREARQWRFKPGTSDGVPVAMWRQVPITFRLK